MICTIEVVVKASNVGLGWIDIALTSVGDQLFILAYCHFHASHKWYSLNSKDGFLFLGSLFQSDNYSFALLMLLCPVPVIQFKFEGWIPLLKESSSATLLQLDNNSFALQMLLSLVPWSSTWATEHNSWLSFIFFFFTWFLSWTSEIGRHILTLLICLVMWSRFFYIFMHS